MMNTYDKIPIEQVLDDMNNPKGGIVSYAARDYYYLNYASPEEQKKMDREDLRQTIFAIVFGICFVVLIVAAIVSKF